MTEIAPVLRHTNLSSTAIYAKVDRTALRALARPWPLAGAGREHARRGSRRLPRVRRALGYKLDRQGRQLLQFVAYLDEVGATTVTIEHAVGWAILPAGATAGYWCDRLSVVRQFARYLQTIDPACEVPAKGLLPYRRERPIPFLFTPAEIERVMRAAGRLRGELHAATTQTLIGLMAVTGIRVGEAIGLGRDDVDRPGQLIRVLDGKFAKSREVAVHADDDHSA